MKTNTLLTLGLALVSSLIMQTHLHGAAFSSFGIAASYAKSQLFSQKTSQHLIDQYTDTLINKAGASAALNEHLDTFLKNKEGKLVLSKDFDALDIEAFDAQHLPNRLPPKMLAEFIYMVHNKLSDKPEFLSIKKLLYTAARHNISDNPAYTGFRDVLSTIDSVLDELNVRLAQENGLYNSDDDDIKADFQGILPLASPRKKSIWSNWFRRN